MAVKRCPSCGDLFVLRTLRCPDCDVELELVAEEPDVAASGQSGGGGAPVEGASAEGVVAAPMPGGQEAWELQTLTMEGRRLVAGMLAKASIPGVWHGATLLTPEAEHDRVAEMVEMISAGDARVGVVGEGEAAEESVGYEMGEWGHDEVGRLVAELGEAGIEHRWDEVGDLIVALSDEALVDSIFERLSAEAEAGGGGDGDVDGLAVQESLSDLFVSADRLMHNPLDGNSVRLLLDAKERAERFQVPFGFSDAQWSTIIEAAEELASSFDAEELDETVIASCAATLRALLRDFV